jgi:DNA-binding winged helix-turn-helix (wHTH) protein/Tol biopolymer transport system component
VPPAIFKFADFELDCTRYELRRGGQSVKLEKIPMELLQLLAESNGRLVSREEIEEHLWGKAVFVDAEHGINTAIRKIRQVLGDDPDAPLFLQTVQRKGYRFIAQTTQIEEVKGPRDSFGNEVMPQVGASQVIRFATFEVDLQAEELRKGGLRLKLTGQPFQVLAILLERPGTVVTRENLQKRLWPDTFVDVDHNLNTAINKIREALGDSSENPRFIETLPRRGYRFIGPITVDGTAAAEVAHAAETRSTSGPESAARTRRLVALALLGTVVLLMAGGFWIYKRRETATTPRQRTLTRITFDEGLQVGATWSPDGRYLAYASDRGGKFDIWVQQVGGGNPVQLTKGPDNNWQPNWSPDGRYIAYRSEHGEGGLYIAPALGGAGLERKISSFGYFPRWSPDGSQILFLTKGFGSGLSSAVYVVRPDESLPRPVQVELTAEMTAVLQENFLWAVSAAWHPDGKKISMRIWTMQPSPMPIFFTAPLDGSGPPVRTEVSPEILKAAEDAAGTGISAWADPDSQFSWAPSGTAIYFERTFRGARNIWRMKVDPKTLRATAIERLTMGTDLNSDFSLSSDGRKMAFSSESRKVQAWMFPFDAKRGRVTGSGKAVTSPGVEAWVTSLSPDGRRLAFQAIRAGRWELWQKSLVDGQESPIDMDDSYVRNEPQWSPDGTRLGYVRMKPTGEVQAVIWSKDRGEEPLTNPSPLGMFVFDWSRDGKSLLLSRDNPEGHQSEIWEMPATGSDAEAKERKLIGCDTKTSLWQSRYSPDGRWIVFEAEQFKSGHQSAIYVTSSDGGGPWTQITEGKHWDDKPRWSPDGRTIYYLTERKGFFNVWGIHFDPAKGKSEGEPFQVTTFDNPKLMVADVLSTVGLSLTEDKLFVSVAQVSGSIWVLDNVDR